MDCNMKLTKTAGVLLAVLLVATAGAAALPGNAPADSQAGQADDKTDADTGAPADAGPEMNNSDADSENATDADDRRGPPTDMPAQVPDHVSQIHDLVHQYLDGDIDNLGEHISDLMGGEDAEEADEDAEDSESDEAEEDEMDDKEADDADDADGEEMDDEADEDEQDDSEEDDEMDDETTATPA
jgi:hypothetical protein